ncbi:efflux transporter outer membrane subunit [Pseudomonas viridiflava]|uniref:efflux transporter outer membrane subunit n=1 Tax=Pseudomonas viridiflava TaxID=33069 RepID=UPI0015E31DC5|nr:efflux transporter outer membrane subunit [Pseudomonas viridiflava]MBA1228647.1 efflux transporter outer membrane subunit [Pseudomonas viridiflava]
MPTLTLLSKPIRFYRYCALRGCLGWLMVLAVSGCSLAPDYQRPALPVPATVSASVVFGDAKPSQVALTPDEEQLTAELDPKGHLHTLLLSALAFNRDFRVAGLRVEEARAMRGVTDSDRLPTIAAGLERDRQHFDNKAANERYGQDISIASLGISNYELDFFGRLRSLSDAARHDYLATAYGQQAARSALIAEVAQGWLAERMAAAMQADAQTISDTRSMLQGLAEGQQRAGAISLDDVAVQRQEVLTARQQLQDAISDHSRASQALLLLTGYSAPLPAMTLDAAPLQLAATQLPAGLANLPSQRLLERFDVRQREEALKASNANIGAARAAFFPSITLSTGIGVQSDSLSSLFSHGSGAWLFSPQLNLPLFDGGRNRANLDLAQVRKEIAVAEYEKTIQAAFREMADVLTHRQQALDHVRDDVERVALVQEKVRRMTFELAAGGADRRAPLTSAIRVAEADATFRKSLNELQQNRLDIYRVLHGAEPVTSSPLTQTGVAP